MALKSNLVNLDAMIKREDFAASDSEAANFEQVATISLRDFTAGGLMGPSLRKPDFQRETNHWIPDQVVSLLECFVSGDLIPSVILWQSPTYLFVIDGGHRLSVLRAWVEDDYGDGPTSQAFFGYQISADQKKTAVRTRELVAEKVGTWSHFQARIAASSLDPAERGKLTAVISRGLPIQWVRGDADKAETSFFKINTKGTPLDQIEELLLKNRHRPVSIAARAVIRAGKGHKYWSGFKSETATAIEEAAKELHSSLFDPEINTPIKTLDLPLGGPKGLRIALQVLIEVILIAIRNQDGQPQTIADLEDDEDGQATLSVLKRTLDLFHRITGNDRGSLGLHPAVYFYGPTGRHSSAMFMGTVTLIAWKLAINDRTFFDRFSKVRARLESLLVEHKDLIATILQKHVSGRRIDRYASLLDQTIDALLADKDVTQDDLIRFAALDGKIVMGGTISAPKKFSDDSKSEVFIQTALNSSVKCPICSGYLDTVKSVSYDHIQRAAEGGPATSKNLQMTHPYCNQSVKG
ncbi:GmrSD restriction endonuclease domain-containing protein [Polaromonas sp.]|uniref:GmrSD restriction endonuclease domain-containing protein n=1 Tax=Polaromonas sp. TaxID=1869339 RepID=UPI003BA8AE6E